MRILDWNIEHMNSWFVSGDDPAMRASFAGSEFGGGPIDDVPALALRVAAVINTARPDLITIQEGAGLAEVQGWADEMLVGDWSILGGSGGAQKLLVMWRTDDDSAVDGAAAAAEDDIGNRLADDWEADVDGDFTLGEARFARPPLVVDVEAHASTFRLLNCHSKSKHVKGGEELWNGTPEERQLFVREALKARRRISAEGFRIREYLDNLFAESPDRHVIVAGDLNDGIGFDYFERKHLTHSVVDLIFGSIFHPAFQLRHVLLEPTMAEPPHSAEFFDFVAGERRRLLLDHIGVSRSLEPWLAEARILHAEYAEACSPALPSPREQRPSDHRPVLAVLAPPT